MNNVFFDPKILNAYFSDFVRFLCRSCKRYDTKWTCPPRIEDVDYYRIYLHTFKYGILVYKKFEFDKSNLTNWQKLGQESSLEIQNELIEWNHRITHKEKVLLFGAGSCKVCKTCDSVQCRFPDKAIIPVEGTGIDVMRLFKDLTAIDLKFPVEEQGYFYRIGVILYT